MTELERPSYEELEVIWERCQIDSVLRSELIILSTQPYSQLQHSHFHSDLIIFRALEGSLYRTPQGNRRSSHNISFLLFLSVSALIEGSSEERKLMLFLDPCVYFLIFHHPCPPTRNHPIGPLDASDLELNLRDDYIVH